MILVVVLDDCGVYAEFVSPGGDPNFYKVRFNASKWPFGQAGFGTTGGACPWNNTTDVNTQWDTNTDMLVRHSIILPSDAVHVHIAGTIDNDATVYLNGHQLQYVQSGNCQAGVIGIFEERVPPFRIQHDVCVAIHVG